MTKSVAQLEKIIAKSMLIVIFENEGNKKVIQQLNLYQTSEIHFAVNSARSTDSAHNLETQS